MKMLNIERGAMFLVPLAQGKFVVGVVINADGRGRAVGAFFGPTVSGASEVHVSNLQLKNAVLVCRFGDHGLHTKRWPVIGSIPNWAVAPWSVSKFARRHDDPDRCYVTEYDDSLSAISERVVPAAEGKMLPDDAQYGSGVVEVKLAKLVQ
jgi:hypothetical protein